MENGTLRSMYSATSEDRSQLFDRTANAMPSNEQEILDAFEAVLAKKDLPPDKMRILRDCDLKKKWDLVCDEHQFTHNQCITEPHVYLNQLRAIMDKKKSAKKKKKILAGDSPTKILKHLEISLRTNSIEWVRAFLSPQNNGLQVVVDYLTLLQQSLLHPEKRRQLSGAMAPSSVATTSRDQRHGHQSPTSFVNEDGISIQTQPQQSLHFFSASGGSSASSMPFHNNNSHIYGSGLISSFSVDKSHYTLKSGVGPLSVVAASSKNSFKAPKNKFGNCHPTEVEDEQHIILRIFRALLDSQFGLPAMLSSNEAIYCIVRSILHPHPKTVIQALDLLAGILRILFECDDEKHDLVLNCFSRLQREYDEPFRFQILMYCFMNPDDGANIIDFLASCIKFINLLVHNSYDMNQRIALQYEFSPIDDYLDKLAQDYSETELMKHLDNYFASCINVHKLYEESLSYAELKKEFECLQEDYSRQKEEFQVLEANCYYQITQFNQQKIKLAEERDEIERQNAEKITTLTRDWREKERKFERDRVEYEKRINMLEKAKQEIKQGLKVAQSAATQAKLVEQQRVLVGMPTTSTSAVAKDKVVREQRENRQSENERDSVDSCVAVAFGPPPSKAPQHQAPPQRSTAPPPPPPPPPPLAQARKGVQHGPKAAGGGAPPPPPPPLGLFIATASADCEQMPKKKIANIGSKMPMINWTALNPNQVKGTVFNNMNDEKLAEMLDLSKLEVMFSLEEKKPTADQHHQNMDNNNAAVAKPRGQPSPNATSNCGKNTLLSTKRLQNIGFQDGHTGPLLKISAIIRRKIGKSAMDIMTAVHRFDFSVLTSDQVDVLLPIIPTAEEITKLQEFAKHNNGNFDSLTAEDQFLAKLMDIERLERKLTLMKFMSDFADNVRLIIPVLQKVTAASKSVQNAQKFPKVIELILAIGNAMNGARRTPVYGFKIASLDSLTILKSPKDRNCTLMHILAEIIADKFSELLEFTTELKLAESAAPANFETIVADVKEIDTKFEQILSEQKRRGKDESPESLNAFIESSSSQLISLKENFKLAQQSFLECSQYYGEGSSAVPDVFFTRIASFCKHFEVAHTELEARKASEKRQEQEQRRRKSAQMRRANLMVKAENSEQQQQDKLIDGQGKVIDELSQKLGQRNFNSFKDGDFELLMAELKETGFVAPNTIAVKSQLRRKSPSPSRQKPSTLLGDFSRERNAAER